MNGDGDQVVAHLVRALVAHRRWCRSRGHQFPAVLELVLAALAAGTGHGRTIFGESPESVDAGDMEPRSLLLDDAAAAKRLSVSPRTVRRFRASGALPTVVAGRRRLIRVTDLEKFVANGGTE